MPETLTGLIERVIPIYTQHYMMLQRNLFYTAVTRGKKLVLVETKKALGMSVRRQDTAQEFPLKRLAEDVPPGSGEGYRSDGRLGEG